MTLLALLLLQADPAIESVERLAGDVARPLLWTPVRVVLSSRAGWEGDLVSRSRFGFRVARRVRVPAGGRVPVLLPTLDAETVEAGAAAAPIPRARGSADLVVAVDSRLPFAAELASTDQVHYVRVEPAAMSELLATGLLEAADLVLLSDAAGLELGGPCDARVVRTREEAERAAAPGPRVEARDAPAWGLRPDGGWVPAKRGRAALFAGFYGFVGFVALAFAGRRGGRAPAVAVAALVILGSLGAATVIPRGQLFVQERAVELVRPDGTATEWRLWFAVSPSPGPVTIEFPRLARPVFAGFEGTDRPFTLRVEERGCRVEGLELGPGRAAAFVTSRGRPASDLSKPLSDGWERKGGAFRPLDGSAGFSEPKDAEFRAWGRFLQADAIFGRLGGPEAVDDVASPQLADARRTARYVIRRLP